MKDLERSEGFKCWFSATYTPEQASDAERTNGVLLSCARTMLIAVRLNKSYWGYALQYAGHIINCTGKVRLGGKSPFEMLTGQKPSWKYFRVFGCRTWVFIPKAQRKKWDPRAKLGIFVGFSDSASAYLVRVPADNKTYGSVHCIFDESAFGGAPPADIDTYEQFRSNM